MKVIKYLPKVKLAESYKLHNLGPEAMQYLASSKLTFLWTKDNAILAGTKKCAI
jgi:hypothetical protein